MDISLNGTSAGFVLFFIFFFVFMALPGILIYKVFRNSFGQSNKKYLKGKTVVPQYEPPENLRPAEIGMLFDDAAGRLETLGVIYDLRVRKVIDIDDSNPQHMVATLKQYPAEGLAAYEDLLLRFLFHESRDVVLNGIVRQADFTYLQWYMNYQYMQELQRKGYLFFDDAFLSQSFQDYMSKLLNGSAIDTMRHYTVNQVAAHLTQKAKDQMPLIEGFRLFITTAELDRIRFELQDKAEEYIEHMTPYAIVLNQLERWRLITLPAITVQTGGSFSTNLDVYTGDYEQNIASYNSELFDKFDAYQVTEGH